MPGRRKRRRESEQKSRGCIGKVLVGSAARPAPRLPVPGFGPAARSHGQQRGGEHQYIAGALKNPVLQEFTTGREDKYIPNEN